MIDINSNIVSMSSVRGFSSIKRLDFSQVVDGLVPKVIHRLS